MKGYDSYKNSGIDWIGEIPNSWSVVKLKHISNIYNGNSLNDDLKEKFESDNLDYIPYISTKDVEPETGKININNGIRIPLNENNFKIAPKGSFVLCIEGGSAGKKVGFLSEDVYFVNKLACFDYNNKYLYYYALSEYFKNQFFNSLSGLIGGVSISTIRNFFTTFPSLEEQTKIAAFLDYKTNLIDATIEKKKRLIELLKEKRQAVINEAVTKGLNPNVSMKDSGLEWLGEIPEHWEVAKLKYNATISFSSVDRHEYKEEMNVSICHYPDAYKNDKINSQTILSTGTCTELEFEKFQLKKNQVIITKDSESANDIGVPTYVEETLENAVCGYHLAILEPQSNRIHGEFLFRFIQTSNVAIYFENNSNGVTRFGLGKPKIENLFVVIPSIEEQLLIAKFINNQLELIENSISKIKSVIEKLQDYRQSLISEAVTGKIDVRDWPINFKNYDL